MSARAVSVVLFVSLVVAACGGASESSPSDDSLPPVASGFDHPLGADDVVIEYLEVGGFTTREFAFQQTPNVLVSGDGRVFGPGAQIEIFPGPLLPAVQVQSITESGIQTILAAADDAGLLTDVEYEQPTNSADAPTAQVTINVNGETFVHQASALGLAFPGGGGEESSPERQALAGFIADLSDLPALVGAGELGEQRLFEPASYGIDALVIDDLAAYGTDGIEPTVVDWPAASAVRLAEVSPCTVVPADEVGAALAQANQLTFFTDDEVTYQVFAKPILPGTPC